jgi:hypothetical protein
MVALSAPATVALGSFYYNLAMFWKTGQVTKPVITRPPGDVWSNVDTQGVQGNCDQNTVAVDIYVDDVFDNSVACVAGAFSGSITRTADGPYGIRVQGRDITGNTSALTSPPDIWTRDTVPPHLSVFTLNGSCSSTIATNQVPADVQIDNKANSTLGTVRFSLNSVFSDDTWQPYSDPTTYAAPFVAGTPVTRIVFVWVKDKAGNLSTNSLTCQVTTNIGLPPDVKVIDPIGGAPQSLGDAIQVDWTISSIPGLAAGAVELDYTFDDGATYTVMASGLDDGPNSGILGNTESCGKTLGSTGCVRFDLPAALDGRTYKLIVRATDVNGAVGIALSAPQNIGGLRLFAGNDSSKMGGSALATSLDLLYSAGPPTMAINSKGDLYVIGNNCVIYVVDGLTGNVSQFMGNGVCTGIRIDGTAPSDTLTSGMARALMLAFDSQDQLYFDYSAFGEVLRLNKATGLFEVVAGGGSNYKPGTGDNATGAWLAPNGIVLDSQDRAIILNIEYYTLPIYGAYDPYYPLPQTILRVNTDGKFELLVGDHSTRGPIDGDLGTLHGLSETWDMSTYYADVSSNPHIDPWGNPWPIADGYEYASTMAIKRGSPDIIYFLGQAQNQSYTFHIWGYDTATKIVSDVTPVGNGYAIPGPLLWSPAQNRLLSMTYWYDANTSPIYDCRDGITAVRTDMYYDQSPTCVDLSGGTAPTGLAVDNSGGMYYVANNHLQIYYIDPTTQAINPYAGVAPDAGDGGDAKLAEIRWAWQPSVDSAGNTYFFDAQNRSVRMISTSGIISKIMNLGGLQWYDQGGVDSSDHFIWDQLYGTLIGYGGPQNSGSFFDISFITCLFFCAPQNMAPAPISWPLNVPEGMPDGSDATDTNVLTGITAYGSYTPVGGFAYDPTTGSLFFNQYAYNWPPNDASTSAIPYTEILGRIDTNGLFYRVSGIDSSTSDPEKSFGDPANGWVPTVGAPTVGNTIYEWPVWSAEFASSYTGPGHVLHAYNNIVYVQEYNRVVYAYDTNPGGLVSQVSDPALPFSSYSGSGSVDSFWIDAPNNTMYFTVDSNLYQKPIDGGSGTSTPIVTGLPYQFWIGAHSPNPNSLLLLHKNQIYEYTDPVNIY